MKTINEYIKETRNIEPLSGIEKYVHAYSVWMDIRCRSRLDLACIAHHE